MANFKKDKDLQKFVMEVANTHHEDKVDKATFLAVFRDPPEKNNDKVTAGKAIKVSGMYKSISDDLKADFIIIIAEDEWKGMNEQKRQTLIDHQLSHCGIHEDAKDPGKRIYKILPHDVGEFAGVFGRHGTDCDEMVQMIEASGQMNLFKD